MLDLFSGIGGFSLGLERAGMKTVAFCEIDKFCRQVLAKHWPGVPIYDDVRSLTAAVLARDAISPDVLCGGFPCQDISLAGKGAGLAGERSGLWREYRRLIEEIRPAWVVIENVSALRSRGLDVVLGSLAALRYDAEWHCIPASAIGAPHRRDRVWIIAYPHGQGEHAGAVDAEMGGASEPVADSDQHPRLPRWLGDAIEGARGRHAGGSGVGEDGLANADQPRLEGRLGKELSERAGEWTARTSSPREAVPDTDGEGRAQPIGPGQAVLGTGPRQPTGPDGGGRDHWLVEPDVGRVANGVPKRVDRLRALGNAVVPQIPEMIGRAIIAHDRNLHA